MLLPAVSKADTEAYLTTGHYSMTQFLFTLGRGSICIVLFVRLLHRAALIPPT